MGMNNGKPFQSKLEPHFDFILEARRKRETWQAIAEQLATQGITTTKQAVHVFLKRRLKRRYPLGAVPAESRPAPVIHRPVERPLPEIPELTETLTPLSDFTADALTRPLMSKKKPMWAILKPNP